MTEKIVGCYRIGFYRVNFHEKPALWHRLWMRVLLGFVWEDV